MKALILVSFFTILSTTASAQNYKQYIGKTYNVVKSSVGLRNSSLKDVIAGIEEVQMVKSEKTGEIQLLITQHSNDDIINRDLIDIATDSFHFHGLDKRVHENKLIWCEEDITTVKTRGNKITSKHESRTYLFCAKMFRKVHSKSKVVLLKTGDSLHLKIRYKRKYRENPNRVKKIYLILK